MASSASSRASGVRPRITSYNVCYTKLLRFGHHVPKGYIYFAMAFSFVVEMLNIRLRKRGTPVDLHAPYAADKDTA